MQVNKSYNKLNSLDSETIYFVEKFGYLMRKMNEGYGHPVKEVLFDRINTTISNFKVDLPIIIQNLEIKRLKSVFNRNKKKIDAQGKQSDNKSLVSRKSDDVTKTINEKISSIQNNISDKIKIASQINSEELVERQTQSSIVDKPTIKQTVFEEEIDLSIDDVRLSKRLSDIENKASNILKPSMATIKEQQRLKRIQAMLQKKESTGTKLDPAPAVNKKPITDQKNTKPVQKLTAWERKWNKYNSDFDNKEFKSYT